MTEDENESKYNYEKIADSIISYLEFIKKFKKVISNEIIINEPDNNFSKFSYIFRDYNVDCYIIERNFFDDFKSAVNFNDLTSILDPINDENKNKFKNELKIYLNKNPLHINNIKIFSKKKELKEIVKNFNNYSFINKELLIDGMGISESRLKDNLIKVSKNENNTSLLSVNENFIINIKIEKVKDNKKSNKRNIPEYKNLYYVEEITKKIFVLLYYNEKVIKQKIKKNIKDIYNFKKYYLINRNWLNQYKEFYLYNIIKEKLDKNCKNFSYKKAKISLNNILINIGQIKLFAETQISEKLRNALNLRPKMEKIILKNEINNEYQQDTYEIKDTDISYDVPSNFYLINEDIYNLLKKEDFFYNINEDIENKISYDILFGNNQIIMKNKLNEKLNPLQKFLNNFLIYFEENKISNEQIKNKIDNNDNYILKYILNYKKDFFFVDFKNIIEKVLYNYISKNAFNLDKFNCEQIIYNNQKKSLGYFINIGILNEDEIKNLNLDSNKDNLTKKEIEDKLINTNKISFNDDKLQINKINININNISKDNNNDKIKNEKKINIDKNIITLFYNPSYDMNSNNTKEKDNIISYNDGNIISFEKLKRKIKLIEPYMKILYKKLDNNEIKNIDLKILIPDEIIRKKRVKI